MIQRVPPSHARSVRGLDFTWSSPFTCRPFSTSIGPARERRCRIFGDEFPSSRRMIALEPLVCSHHVPLPSELGFHEPMDFPYVITRPRGRPSGVKNPPFTAASAWQARPASRLSFQIDAGPSVWSAMASRCERESKVTPWKEMPKASSRKNRGRQTGDGEVLGGVRAGTAAGRASAVLAMRMGSRGARAFPDWGTGWQAEIASEVRSNQRGEGNDMAYQGAGPLVQSLVATASNVWNVGCFPPRSAMVVSTAEKPAAPRSDANSASPKPSRRSAYSSRRLLEVML